MQFHTRDRVSEALISTRAGSFNTIHGLAIMPRGKAASGAGGYLAASSLYSDGPFDAAQAHRRINLFGKWTAPLGQSSELFAQASGFAARWNASGQIPARAVREGVVDRFGSLDPCEGGRTARADVSLGARSLPGGNDEWHAQLFATHYDFDLFSNFTFFLNDPVHGDGIEQRDERWLTGATADFAHVPRARRPERTSADWCGLPRRLHRRRAVPPGSARPPRHPHR